MKKENSWIKKKTASGSLLQLIRISYTNYLADAKGRKEWMGWGTALWGTLLAIFWEIFPGSKLGEIKRWLGCNTDGWSECIYWWASSRRFVSWVASVSRYVMSSEWPHHHKRAYIHPKPFLIQICIPFAIGQRWLCNFLWKVPAELHLRLLSLNLII